MNEEDRIMSDYDWKCFLEHTNGIPDGKQVIRECCKKFHVLSIDSLNPGSRKAFSLTFEDILRRRKVGK